LQKFRSSGVQEFRRLEAGSQECWSVLTIFVIFSGKIIASLVRLSLGFFGANRIPPYSVTPEVLQLLSFEFLKNEQAHRSGRLGNH
jgi:hypothetical protein